jgi:hypothetical protein
MFLAFIPVILSQGSDEQIQKWIGPALSHSIIGCYAQTELGHGSNVAGLMTTATYDRHSDEFILHSPSLAVSFVNIIYFVDKNRLDMTCCDRLPNGGSAV